MKNKRNLDYYVGLDNGTNSVGFAVTDKDYNVINVNKKNFAGVRLFEEAQTAKERRESRSSRRRLQRRKNRIQLLQNLFLEEVSEVDPVFFIKLKESALREDDKSVFESKALFGDIITSNQNYYKNFKTIYHLRDYLTKHIVNDVRLVYLATHHIIKNRGHFLNAGNSKDFLNNSSILSTLKEINEYFAESELFCNLSFNLEIAKELEDVINSLNLEAYKEKYKTKTISQKELSKQILLQGVKDSKHKAIVSAMIGDKINLSSIFYDKETYEDLVNELKDFKFSNDKFEELYMNLISDYENEMKLIELLHNFYNQTVLMGILKKEKFISSAMVSRYNSHNADLKKLKHFIKTNYSNKTYYDMFKNPNINGNYASYVGTNLTSNKKSIAHCKLVLGDANYNSDKFHSQCDYKTFLDYVEKVLKTREEQLKDKDTYQEFMTKITEKTFMPKLRTKDNSVLPYQLNEIELQTILNKQAEKFEFLNKTDEYGSAKDKIISLLKFKIPYFVGPLNDKDAEDGFAWVVKNQGYENEKITPWNYKEIVNETESAEKFIKRMTLKGTYLKNEDVLPKQSLLYERYTLLNELNSLKINGDRINKEIKVLLLENYFNNIKSVSKKGIQKFLLDNKKISKEDMVGKGENDENFTSSLSSYIKFEEIFGDHLKNKKIMSLCEDVILWHTIFGNEKRMVEEKIVTVYLDELQNYFTDEEIKKIIKALKGLSFSGWGRFSEKFLIGIKATDLENVGTPVSIMEILEHNELNLMEILNSEKFSPTFIDLVKEENNLTHEEVDYEYVKNLYCSPSVKKSVWQTNLIIDEIVSVMGHLPNKIFIETTRQNDPKKKGKVTNSRRKNILEKYGKAVKVLSIDISELQKELKEKTDNELRGDALYLYFMQLGKCAYTGEPIDLYKLNKEKLYDIDHIYPQSKIKDDSLTNKVLVKRVENAHKSDDVLSDDIRNKQAETWKLWEKLGLISKEKLGRLTRKEPLTVDEMTAFINRQLVSTNQSVKIVKDMFDLKYNQGGTDKVKIVFSKANNVSDFRKKFNIIKNREINNLHHAKDAYLNIVVGNTWDCEFGNLRKIKAKEKYGNIFNEEKAIDKLFERKSPGWNTEINLKTVKKYCEENNYLISYKTYTKKGAFFKETLFNQGSSSNLIPIKESKKANGELLFDPNKYGGYNDRSIAHFVLCEINNSKLTLVGMPVMYSYKNFSSEQEIEDLLKNLYGYKNLKIIVDNVPINSLFIINGTRYLLLGKSGNAFLLKIDVEWYASAFATSYTKDMLKFMDLVTNKQLSITSDKKASDEPIVYAVSQRNNIIKINKELTKEKNHKLFDEILNQLNKPFYALYSTKFRQAEKQEEAKSLFVKQSTYNQILTLKEMLKFVTDAGTLANMKSVGGNENETCKVVFGKNLKDFDFKIINQSVTGIFENKNKKVEDYYKSKK
jgi:CRISPR-associated endonuclease Csn1